MPDYQVLDHKAYDDYGLSLLGVMTISGVALQPYYDQAKATEDYDLLILWSQDKAFWRFLNTQKWQNSDHPIDDFTHDALSDLQATYQALAYLHPSSPPYPPLQQWAIATQKVFPSPIRILVHPEKGLWFGLRGVLIFPHDKTQNNAKTQNNIDHRKGDILSPCLDCSDQPCLSTCPVNAFKIENYDVKACANYVDKTKHNATDCHHKGCLARQACPLNDGQEYPNHIHHYLMDNLIKNHLTSYES
jgi:hypothetical protein